MNDRQKKSHWTTRKICYFFFLCQCIEPGCAKRSKNLGISPPRRLPSAKVCVWRQTVLDWNMTCEDRRKKPGCRWLNGSSRASTKWGQTCSGRICSGWWFGTMEFYDFPFSWNFIIPTDFHSIIFQRGRRKTTNRCVDFQNVLIPECTAPSIGSRKSLVSWRGCFRRGSMKTLW